MLNHDEIIELTKQAGGFSPTPEFLEAFAKLVVAKERSRLAQEVEDIRSDECDFKKFEDTHNDGWLDACNAVLDTLYGWGRDFESRK